MRRIWVALAVLAVVVAITSPVHAQSGLAPSARVGEQGRQSEAAQKDALARQVLQGREDVLQREPFGSAFRQHWLNRLTKLSLRQLLSVSDAGPYADLEESIAAALAEDAPRALGNTGGDLVFTKLAPCRIADTRIAGGGLGTGTSRDFYVAGTTPFWFTGQGGGPCGIPIGATSIAINVTVVGAGGYGWLRAYPYGGSGNASVINYKTGDTIANAMILPICDPAGATCTKDLTVVADAYGGHVILDVMGYFQYVNKAEYQSIITTGLAAIYAPVPAAPGCQSFTSVTVAAPGPGVIFVNGSATIEMAHVVGIVDTTYFGIATAPTDCSFAWGTGGMAYTTAAAPAGYYYGSDYVIYSTNVAAAGTYTFYLTATKLSGLDNHFQKGNLTATFHPR